jgi:hypothetical protein
MSQSEYGLHRVSNAELTRLLRALHRGALPSPISRSSLIEKAFGHVEAHLDLLIGRDIAAAKAVLLAVLGERGAEQATAGARHGATALSYMGPPSPGTRSRDTLEQVRELLASASSSAHLYGLRVDDDRGLLRTVSALIAGRDARVRLVFDGYGLAEPVETVRAFATQRLASRGQQLELFVCTTARLGARVAVVDARRVLVTSGDLTGREEDGSIEFGVLLQDAALADAIEDEWTKLLAQGAVLDVPLNAS